MTQNGLSKTDNLFDFFHERVDAAVAHQRAPVSEEGVFYLTNLLVEQGRAQAAQEPQTLVELHLRARTGDRRSAILSYREMGDRALYLTGFFRKHLDRGLVSLEYYLHMGAAAYGTLADMLHLPRTRQASGHRTLSEIYHELGRRFEACSNVLLEVEQEVRSEGETRNDVDVLRLYERWLETGSLQAARRLQELGVIPMRHDGDPC